MGNWILGVVLAVAAVLGVYVAKQTERTNQEVRTSYAHSLAGNMQVYRNSVIKYAQEHATESGEVDALELALPAWYNGNSDIRNHVVGGLGYVYVTVQNDGQARQLLESTDGDLLVGIKRDGVLYNPIAGTTQITLPEAIPEGAVVFAPAALPTAGPLPSGPSAPADCGVSAGTARSWTVSGVSCSDATISGTTIAHAAALTFTDAAPGNTGSAQFYCNNGTLESIPGGTPTCSPPPGCSVAAGTSRAWTVGGVSCGGPHGAATVASGDALTFTSSNGNIGTAGFVCTEGVLSATPDGSETCSSACVVPAPTTETETRTGTQNVACPASQPIGTITQQRPEERTRTTSASCPDPAGAPVWGAPSAWTAWTATGAWATTSNTCGAACVVPPPQTNTESRTGTQTLGCAPGYLGTRTQSRPEERTQTRTATCPDPAGAPVWAAWSAWSAWTGSGAWATTSDTCAPECVVPSPSTQTDTQNRTATQTIAGCPSGYTGTITQTRPETSTRTRSAYCPAATGAHAWGGWSGWSAWAPAGGWTTTSSSCTAVCTPPANSSVPISRSLPVQTQDVGCPSGQTGNHWQDRPVTEAGTRTTSWTCPGPTSTSSDTWGGGLTYGAWYSTLNTCVASAPPAPNCGGTPVAPTPICSWVVYAGAATSASNCSAGNYNWTPGSSTGYWCHIHLHVDPGFNCGFVTATACPAP